MIIQVEINLIEPLSSGYNLTPECLSQQQPIFPNYSNIPTYIVWMCLNQVNIY